MKKKTVDLHNRITVSGLETLFRNSLDSLWNGNASPDKLPPMKILPDDEELIRHTVYGLVGNRAGVNLKELTGEFTTVIRANQIAILEYCLRVLAILIGAGLPKSICVVIFSSTRVICKRGLFEAPLPRKYARASP